MQSYVYILSIKLEYTEDIYKKIINRFPDKQDIDWKEMWKLYDNVENNNKNERYLLKDHLFHSIKTGYFYFPERFKVKV